MESCKRLKFELTTKWYMYKPESTLENVKHKLFLGFGKTNGLLKLFKKTRPKKLIHEKNVFVALSKKKTNKKTKRKD